MKYKLTFFGLLAALIFVFSLTEINAQEEKEKYYIVFSNLEKNEVTVDLGNGQTTTLTEYLYHSRLAEDPNFGIYTEFAPFGPSTFAKKPITDYDVAIFPMGAGTGLNSTYGGMKIYDQVKKMLEAGKGVILAGSTWMSMAAMDSEVEHFLSNELRLEYGRYETSTKEGNTTTYVRFDLKGEEDDPVVQGFTKVCNTKYSENGSEMAPPFRWYADADFFVPKTSSLVSPFDKVIPSDPDLWGGGRWISPDGGRLVFWSVGFDVITKIHDSKIAVNMINGVRWITERMLKPEQWIEAEINNLNFEKVEPGDSKIDEVRIRNFGKEPLTITETSIENIFADEGIFTIHEGGVENGEPIVLEPNEFITIKVKFEPTSEVYFEDALLIKSDAVNSNGLTIGLEGTGGEQIEKGPRISDYDFPVDFGKIKLGKKVDKEIPITNTGNVTLIVFTLDTTINEGNSFLYPEQINTPQVIQPGESWNIPIRFFPLQPDATYRGQLKLTSNANNIDTLYIDLIGRTEANKKGPDALVEVETIQFGDVVERKDKSFFIKNTGDMDLLLANVYVDADNETKESFPIISEKEATIAPADSFEVIVSFQPVRNQKYVGELVLTSNAKVYDEIRILMSGNGLVSVNENGEAGFQDIFTMKLNPNPVIDNTTLHYNINNNSINNLNIYIIDAAGNKMQNIFSGKHPAGEFNKVISASSLSSGMYYIIAEIDGKKTHLPLVIQK